MIGSAWGKSWGSSWGNSWGFVDVEIIDPITPGGVAISTQRFNFEVDNEREYIQDDQELVLLFKIIAEVCL